MLTTYPAHVKERLAHEGSLGGCLLALQWLYGVVTWKLV
jgi:hypothetical protein